ncbi:MAG: hypothetical protein KA792_02415, partial [Bacteroidales bacterium]|nr:hypothetical protein [Bacteroidales bacterium]
MKIITNFFTVLFIIICLNNLKSQCYIKVDAGEDREINCGKTSMLYARLYNAGSATVTYKWSPSSSLTDDNVLNPTAFPLSTTMYKVIVTTSEGCVSTDSVLVTVKPLIINAGIDQEITCGESALLNIVNYSELVNISDQGELLSVYFTDENTGYAVGMNGVILKTNNAGFLWKRLNSGLEWRLRSIYFLDDYTGFIIGELGIILKTTDAGLNWTKIETGVDTEILSIYFTDKNTGYVVGCYGLILKTVDAGLTWTKLKSDVSDEKDFFSSIVFTDANTGYIAGTTNILKTIDAGLNWFPIYTEFTHYNKIFFTDSNTGYVLDNTGYVLKTIDAGKSWSKFSLASDKDFFSLFFYDTNLGFVVGRSGTILQTTNGGLSWTKLNNTETGDLYSVFVTKAKTYYFAGSNGILRKNLSTYKWEPASSLDDENIKNPIAQPIETTTYKVTVSTTEGCTSSDAIKVNVSPLTVKVGNEKTIPCGEKYQLNPVVNSDFSTIYNKSDKSIYSIYFTNKETGYAVGRDGYLLKTTDSGLNWDMLNSGTSKSLSEIFFINENTGYAVGSSGTIVKTSNAALEWINLNTGITNELYSIWFTDINTGIAVGAGSTVLKTTNAGKSWTKIYTGIEKNFYSVCFTDSNTGYITGDDGTILKTTNGGEEWFPLSSNTTNILYSICFTDANTGYIVGRNGVILKTINAGLSWKIKAIFSTSVLTSISFNDNNIGYAVGNEGVIVKTVDGGDTWVKLNAKNNNSMTSIFYIKNRFFAVSNAGTIIKSNVYSYEWFPSEGLSADDIQNPIANPTNTTTYKVFVSSSDSCLAKDSLKIIVNPLQATIISPSKIVCGSSLQFDCKTNYNDTIPLNYLWESNTGFKDTIKNPFIKPLITTTYTLTVSLPNTLCQDTSIKIINVDPIMINAGDDIAIACGKDYNLNASSNYNGSSLLTYKWYPETGLSNPNISNPIINTEKSTEYTVEVSNDFGCNSATDNVKVNIKSLDFKLSFTQNQQVFTSPPFNVLFVNTTPNKTNYDFQWDFGDGDYYNGIDPPSHSYKSNGKYTVKLIGIEKAGGCIDTLIMPEYIVCIGGTECDYTVAIEQSSPVYTCVGEKIVLSCNKSEEYKYQWLRNGILLEADTFNTINTSKAGEYRIIAKKGVCSVVSPALLLINKNSPPIPQINAVGSISYCAGGEVKLDAPYGYNQYLWSNGQTTQSITVKNPGTFMVTVINNSGCANVSSPYIVGESPLNKPDLCMVSVDDNTNKNIIIWEKHNIEAVDSFLIYKETNKAEVYKLLAKLSSKSFSTYIDKSSEPAKQANRYKIAIKDTCGAETEMSDYHKTMHLTINKGIGESYNLIWSPYEGFEFDSYYIYRGDTPDNMLILDTIASNLYSYTDLNPLQGNNYYMVEVINPNNCNPSKKVYNTAQSNKVNSSNQMYYTISGTVTYDNKANNSLNNVLLKLKNKEGKIISETKTDNNGDYFFTNLQNDKYYIECNNTAKAGGYNPVDALFVNRYYLKLVGFGNNLRKRAADVNIDNNVNPIDALMINRRYIGILKSFKSPDWLFETDTIELSDSDLLYNIKSLCAGDNNGSYTPLSKRDMNLSISTEGIIKLKKGDTYYIPLRLDKEESIGSVGLQLTLKQKGLTILDVKSEMQGMLYNITENGVNIAWSAKESALLNKAVNPLLYIKVKMTEEPLSEGLLELFELNGESIITDYEANTITNLKLVLPFLNTGAEAFTYKIYPNPAKESATLIYFLP